MGRLSTKCSEPASAGGTYDELRMAPPCTMSLQCQISMRHMKRITLALFLESLVLPVYAAAQSHVLYLPPESKPMTVQDVIKLTKAGLSDETIIEQIRAKNQRFDLTTDQLLQLKAAHVSERVIQAMINPGVPSAASSPPAAATPKVIAASAAAKP